MKGRGGHVWGEGGSKSSVPHWQATRVRFFEECFFLLRFFVQVEERLLQQMIEKNGCQCKNGRVHER